MFINFFFRESNSIIYKCNTRCRIKYSRFVVVLNDTCMNYINIMCIYYERRERRKKFSFQETCRAIIVAIIFNNLPNVISEPDFLIVEKSFRFPHFQL